ncbi:unnamed protein product, partial [Sphacelaria rigidula]
RNLTSAERCAALVDNMWNTWRRMEKIVAAIRKNTYRPEHSDRTKQNDGFVNDEKHSPGEVLSRQDEQHHHHHHQQQQQQQQQEPDEYTRKCPFESKKYTALTKPQVQICSEIHEGGRLTTAGGFDSTENKANTQHLYPRSAAAHATAPFGRRSFRETSSSASSINDELGGRVDVKLRGGVGVTGGSWPRS